MDNRTMIVLLSALGIVGIIFFMLANASVQNTKLKTDAAVAKAQENTRRAEGRHDLVDVLGWMRGWKSQREDR